MRPAEVAAAAIEGHGAVQKPAELARFLELALAVRPRVVVEVGSYAGGTLYAWRELVGPDGLVIAIDLPPGSPDGIFAATGAPLRSHGAVVLRADSHQAATRTLVEEMLAAGGGRPVDVLFIDGDHTEAGARADYELYGSLVRPGGLIGFHDICRHPDQPDIQVWRLWEQLRHVAYAVEIIEGAAPWGGIGVLYATGD
jgi:predicted O-methyltransferase YrrM